MSSESSDEELSCTPPELRTSANNVVTGLLPSKSKAVYDAAYPALKDWKIKHKAKPSSENVLLSYFDELSKKYKGSTLWAQHSMLKKELSIHENIDIGQFLKLNAFMKKQTLNPTKAKAFHANEVQKFLKEAPDFNYLATKVVLILGISGALRSHEFIDITVNNIENRGGLYLIKILQTKTKTPRSFTIPEEFNGIFEKYKELRPSNATNDRFLLNYQNGKCTKQVIGKNKIGQMAKQIAEYLQLPDLTEYKGHSFRRTAATLLAAGGGSATDLQQLGGWKSIHVATGYIDDSIHTKSKRGSLISSTINTASTSSKANENSNPELPAKKSKINVIPRKETNSNEKKESETVSEVLNKSFVLQNCNVTINIKQK